MSRVLEGKDDFSGSRSELVSLVGSGVAALLLGCASLLLEVDPVGAAVVGSVALICGLPLLRLGFRRWATARSVRRLRRSAGHHGTLVGSGGLVPITQVDEHFIASAPVRVRLDDGRLLELAGELAIEASRAAPLHAGQRVRVHVEDLSPPSYREAPVATCEGPAVIVAEP